MEYSGTGHKRWDNGEENKSMNEMNQQFIANRRMINTMYRVNE